MPVAKTFNNLRSISVLLNLFYSTCIIVLEIRADICASSPCVNGDQCKIGADSYECDCLEGYYGKLCQIG